MDITADIIKTRESIKRKYLNVKRHRLDMNAVTEENLKPIIEPLKTLVSHKRLKHELKTEPLQLKSEPPQVKTEPPSPPYQNIEDLFNMNRTPSPPPQSIEEEDVFIMSRTPSPRPTQSIEEDVFVMSHTPSGRREINDYLSENFGYLPSKYLSMLVSDVNRKIDTTYGVKYDKNTGSWLIGNSPIEIKGEDLYIKGVLYKGTPGIYELLFMKTPKEYTDGDLLEYRDILISTNAHKRDYNATSQINGNKSFKYRNIIYKLFAPDYKLSGSGMSLNENVQYTYWNDANELVDRLRLLLSSLAAGHTDQINEIISIFRALKEADVIE